MRNCQRGFTLIEVLVAMAITAVIAVLAYVSLSTVIAGVDSVRLEAEKINTMNRAFQVLARDIRQVVNRPIVDEFGGRESALEGGPLARQMLALTRAGWHNSVDLPRSTLQRVAYYLEEDRLIRASWSVLDRSSSSEPREVTLLEGVENFDLLFLDDISALRINRGIDLDRRLWLENWLADVSQPNTVIQLPAALMIRLELMDWGQIERFYVLPPL
ncbi:type II secretion system minor pseudopilin GspJ [Luminiphilus sp. nBUS_07]|uniref:type II secretion system minor pseudopilin GspJ n=1 Tax=Luminiphilus sp. nBUS_07 TaxID=3395314 RepID=UPI003EBF73CD